MDAMDRPHDKSYWVIEDRLLAAEYPGHPNISEGRQRIEFLLHRGFDFFLDLTQPGELEPYDALVTPRGAIHRRLSIVDMAVPGKSHEMIEILDELDAALDAGRRVYLHCWGGVGRTGTVVGCHLVRRGMSGTQALEQIAKWWTTTAKRLVHPRSPQTEWQIAYVINWAKHDPRRI
jgi:protein-tyrosine phosphatase